MTTFLLLASVMTAFALALVGWPLVRAARAGERGLPVTLLVLAVAIPLAAALLYRQFSNWDWDPQAMAAARSGQQTLEQLVARLEARVHSNPRDVDGWLMLGRTRFVTSDYPAAAAAFESAYKDTNGKNLEAVIGYGESLAMVDPGTVAGRAGELFEEALKLDPTNSKALFYGGAAAAARQQPQLARDRWATLVRQPLPDTVRVAIAIRIGQLDEQLGRMPDPEIAKLAQPSPAAEAAVPAAAAAPATPAEAGVVTVRVSLSPALAGRVPPGAPLFVLARDPAQPGPPFAAKRLAGVTLPLEVALSERDAMMPGRTLRDAKQLVIVARYSASGRPTASSGDFYGEVPYELAAGRVAELVIDKQVP